MSARRRRADLEVEDGLRMYEDEIEESYAIHEADQRELDEMMLEEALWEIDNYDPHEDDDVWDWDDYEWDGFS